MTTDGWQYRSMQAAVGSTVGTAALGLVILAFPSSADSTFILPAITEEGYNKALYLALFVSLQ